MAYTDIDDPSAYFQTALFTGNAGTNAITNTGNSDLQPDWVWFKCRSAAEHHGLFDSVRGVTKVIYSNLTNAEDNLSDTVASFNSDGFTMGADSGSGGSFNGSGKTMAAWQWKESATAGFDIVSFTGNGSARTISHSLSAVPKMYIVKNRSTGSLQWRVYHASLGATKHMALDATQAVGTASSVFNNTEPTSSVFSVGTDDAANKNGDNLICYLFAEKKGYSKFGKFFGNGSSDGSYIHLGFSPAFVMVKDSSNAGYNWMMYDNKRLGYNGGSRYLIANESYAESGSSDNLMDFTSNGFKLRIADQNINRTHTYIYMAFAESPFVTSSGVPTTAR